MRQIANPTHPVLAALLGLLLAACSGADPEPGLAFLAIGDQAAEGDVVLRADDDADPTTPGIQVRVALVATAPVVLHVGDQTYQSEPDGSGMVQFEQVTLRPGENPLVAEDETGRRAAAVARVDAPALGIPRDASRVLSCMADDRDPSEPGIQTSILVKAPNVPDQTPLVLWVGDQRFESQVLSGEALVPVSLPAVSAVLPVRAEASVGVQSLSTETEIPVQCALCDILTVAGVDAARAPAGTPLLVGPAHDESAAPGMQAALEVLADGLPGTTVSLKVNGSALGPVAPDADGIARFSDVLLPEVATLEVACGLPGAPDEESRLEVRYDETPPPPVTDLRCSRQEDWITCSWTQPEDPDTVGPLAHWSLRYVAAPQIDTGDWENAIAVPSVPSPENAGITLTALFQIDPTARGVVSLALQSRDEAGNTSPLSNTVTLQP